MGLSVKDPWQEEPAVLRQRTVGHEALRRRLSQAADERSGGGHPLPLYLFGPGGVGTSHLAALARAELVSRGLVVRVVPDALPAVRTADELLRAGAENNGAWTRWNAPPGKPGEAPRVDALVVEGLDRRLAELGSGPAGHLERQKVRGAWTRQGWWVLGTGRHLGPELTQHPEPFYGWFDPEPVEALDPGSARALLERLVSAELQDPARWTARREAWLAAVAGSPRLLTALAEAWVSQEQPSSASEILGLVVERFALLSRTAFRALSPFSQHIAWQIALSPRALSPGELSARLGASPQSIATQARRLADDGVLARTEDRRFTGYALADPMLRYWLETTDVRWADTRAALACALLEASGDDASRDRWHPSKGLHVPEALERLLVRVGSPTPGVRARALLAQLEEPHLHPELARLRELLPAG